MPVPQNILDALDAVQADDDAKTAARADNTAKASALAQAQQDKVSSDAALAAAVAHEATDVQALQVLIAQTYGGAPVTTGT